MRDLSLPGPDGPANILAAVRGRGEQLRTGQAPFAREAIQQQKCSNRANIH
jgi:hypothetical protein